MSLVVKLFLLPLIIMLKLFVFGAKIALFVLFVMAGALALLLRKY